MQASAPSIVGGAGCVVGGDAALGIAGGVGSLVRVRVSCLLTPKSERSTCAHMRGAVVSTCMQHAEIGEEQSTPIGANEWQ